MRLLQHGRRDPAREAADREGGRHADLGPPFLWHLQPATRVVVRRIKDPGRWLEKVAWVLP